MILIDCSPGMHHENDKGNTPFKTVIQLASNLMKEKIIRSRTDQVGVCLYNTVNFVEHDSVLLWSYTPSPPPLPILSLQ